MKVVKAGVEKLAGLFNIIEAARYEKRGEDRRNVQLGGKSPRRFLIMFLNDPLPFHVPKKLLLDRCPYDSLCEAMGCNQLYQLDALTP